VSQLVPGSPQGVLLGTGFAKLFPPDRYRVLAAWYRFEESRLPEYLIAIDREIDKFSARQVPTRELRIKGYPVHFDEMGLSDIEVQVESAFFNRGASKKETRTFELTRDEPRDATTLYVDLVPAGQSVTIRYRVRAISMDGIKSGWSEWRETDDLSIVFGRKELQALSEEDD
jgi:hypothetical protein